MSTPRHCWEWPGPLLVSSFLPQMDYHNQDLHTLPDLADFDDPEI